MVPIDLLHGEATPAQTYKADAEIRAGLAADTGPAAPMAVPPQSGTAISETASRLPTRCIAPPTALLSPIASGDQAERLTFINRFDAWEPRPEYVLADLFNTRTSPDTQLLP